VIQENKYHSLIPTIGCVIITHCKLINSLSHMLLESITNYGAPYHCHLPSYPPLQIFLERKYNLHNSERIAIYAIVTTSVV